MKDNPVVYVVEGDVDMSVIAVFIQESDAIKFVKDERDNDNPNFNWNNPASSYIQRVQTR